MATSDFICVIDGSTSKTARRWRQDMTNGRYCMTLVSEYVRRCPPESSMEQFCTSVTETVRRIYRDEDIPRLEEHPEERATASCIVYSRQRNEIWMIGDCSCAVDGIHYDNPKPYEAAHARKRAVILRALLDSGRYTEEELLADDIGRAAIVGEIVSSMRWQNKTYAVVDGFPILLEKVRTIDLDSVPHTVIMATDGYPYVLPTLKESEEALLRQKRDDPLNIRSFYATKAFIAGNNSFDDRSYIRFTVP